jgi:hypothetical protein
MPEILFHFTFLLVFVSTEKTGGSFKGRAMAGRPGSYPIKHLSKAFPRPFKTISKAVAIKVRACFAPINKFFEVFLEEQLWFWQTIILARSLFFSPEAITISLATIIWTPATITFL